MRDGVLYAPMSRHPMLPHGMMVDLWWKGVGPVEEGRDAIGHLSSAPSAVDFDVFVR